MQFQRFGAEHVLRLESGENVKEAITGYAGSAGIQSAHVEAIGALRDVRLRYWDATTRRYEDRGLREQLEVLSLSGNLTSADGGVKLHLHVVLGRRDFSVVGGHLRWGTAHPTLEVFLRPLGGPLRRSKDEASELDLLELPGDK